MSDRFADSPLDDSIPVSDRPDSTSATTNHGTLSSFTRDKRDGVGYIDDEVHPEVEAQAVELARVAINAIPLDDETEMVEGAGVSHDVSAGEGEAEYEDAEMEEIDEEMVDEQDDYSDHYEDDDDVEYGVEDEDWEVADADFTKQFNRMRRQRAILNPAEEKGGSVAISTSGVTNGAVPLPARNINHRARSSDPSTDVKRSNHNNLGPRPSDASTSNSNTSAEGQKQNLGSRRQQLHAHVVNGLTSPFSGVASAPKSAYQYANQQGKEDRATVEGVLDPRTRNILASMVRRGIVSEIEGCVSTGKEANVYLGIAPSSPPVSASQSITYPTPYPQSLAMKIYKTSILSFKTRSQYIEGEHRFRNSYSKVSNPRKMVRVWAEKELRNLRRLDEGGVRCPVVIEVRENVLVMEMLGDEHGKASPRLKDADIPNSDLPELYGEVLVTMRRIFHRCKLVHGDFSEYNILYHKSHLYIIDVSQSVEHDHPSAFDFLRADIRNIDDFFRKRSGGEVRTLGIKGTFDFVVNERLRVWEKMGTSAGAMEEVQKEVNLEGKEGEEEEEALKDVVRNWLAHGVGLQAEVAVGKADLESGASASLAPVDTVSGMAQNSNQSTSKNAADEVFMSSYIPRNMNEVVDPERDMDVMASGGGRDLIYAGVMGIEDKKRELDIKPSEAVLTEEQDAGQQGKLPKKVSFADDSDGSHSEASEGDEDDGDRKPRGFRHEDRDVKKQRKKALKEENREKRKNKMPKAEKQKKIKASSGGK